MSMRSWKSRVRSISSEIMSVKRCLSATLPVSLEHASRMASLWVSFTLVVSSCRWVVIYMRIGAFHVERSEVGMLSSISIVMADSS